VFAFDNQRMAFTWSSSLRRAGIAFACTFFAASASLGQANADEVAPSLPVFVPHPSDWSPDYTVFPYNLWQNRVTPEQVTAQREACQWFNAQHGILMQQIVGFHQFLRDNHDVWAAPGVQAAADAVRANIDQSTAFLWPRADTLWIINWPDQDDYSPLYNGDSIYHLWFQLTQISDKMNKRQPSGVINANIATAHVYSNVIRDSGVCNGA
jgi:hypothetical protein